MTTPRILVAGIGNIFFGDDAFGVEVAQRLLQRELPEAVRVVDFGIRGLDLSYTLLESYEGVILVDAAPRGLPPGTLYVLEPSEEDWASPAGPSLVEPHGMAPLQVLRMAASMGARVDQLILVGCEPSTIPDPSELQDGLSPPVRRSLGAAVELVEDLAARLLRGEKIEGRSVPLSPEGEACHAGSRSPSPVGPVGPLG